MCQAGKWNICRILLICRNEWVALPFRFSGERRLKVKVKVTIFCISPTEPLAKLATEAGAALRATATGTQAMNLESPVDRYWLDLTL